TTRAPSPADRAEVPLPAWPMLRPVPPREPAGAARALYLRSPRHVHGKPPVARSSHARAHHPLRTGHALRDRPEYNGGASRWGGVRVRGSHRLVRTCAAYGVFVAS